MPRTIQSGVLVGVVLLAVPVFANQTYSRLASVAAQARREGKSSVLVDDIPVDPIVFRNPDDQFRRVGAIVVSIVQVDIAQVSSPDSAYTWTKGKVARVLHNGRAEGLGRNQLIESKRTLNGVAAYLDEINKRPGSSHGE